MQMRIAQYQLQLGSLTECKKLVEAGKETLESLSDVRTNMCYLVTMIMMHGSIAMLAQQQ